MNRLSIRAVVASWLLVGAGCGGVPTTHYYLLEPQTARAESSPPSREGLTIAVDSFDVDPPYDQDRIVYRIGEDALKVGFYGYHRWAVPLARMLPQFVADSLRGARGIASVETAERHREHTAVLEGRVRLVEEIDLPQGQKVRLRVDLTLLGAGETIIWTERILAEETVDAADVHEVVRTMSAAMGDSLRQARAGLEKAISDGPARLER